MSRSEILSDKGPSVQLLFKLLDKSLEELEITKEEDLETVIRLAGDLIGQFKVKREFIKQERYSAKFKNQVEVSQE